MIYVEKKLFCKSGGCSAKLGAHALDHVLSKLPRKIDEHLLVGYASKDDAAVYQLREDLESYQRLIFSLPW